MAENRSFKLRPAAAPDRAALETCIIQLQNDERVYESNRAAGEQIAPAYLDDLYRQCADSAGRIIVAESGSQVVGFVCILARTYSGEMIERDQERACITDLIVMPGYRESGIGRALLAAAEQHALETGARTLIVGVLAGNGRAHRLYRKAGFVDSEVVLRKHIQ